MSNRGFALLATLLGAFGCGQGRLVRVAVTGLGQDVTTLRIQATVAGRPTQQLLLRERMQLFWLRVDEDAAGTLEVKGDAQSADQCIIASGSERIEITAGEDGRMELPLRLMDKACEIRATVSGIAAGQVVSQPAGLACQDTCVALFPYGQPVELRAPPGDSAHFSGWDGACKDQPGTCRIAALRGPVEVTAHFSRGLCTTTSFCWESPLPQGNRLLSVWGDASGAVWASGERGTLLRRDSNGWRSFPGRTPADLASVSGSGNEVWVVGSGGVTLRWNGTDLTVDKLLNLNDRLLGVFGELGTETWAVGTSARTARFRAATGWELKDTNDMRMSSLYGIWGTAPDRLFAVGANGTTLRWDGLRWGVINAPTMEVLHAVRAAATGPIWAVGDAGTILRGDGSMWLREPDDPARRQALNAVWPVDAEEVWSGGDGGGVFRRQAGGWTRVQSPLALAVNGIWGRQANDLWLVGADGLMLRWDGTALQQDRAALLDPADPASFAPRTGLRAISGLSARTAWAVGDGGVILAWDGDRWRRERSQDDVLPMPRGLRGVFAAADGVYAVGEQGALLRREGTAAAADWKLVDLPAPLQQELKDTTWNAIHGSARYLFVVGEQGRILRRDIKSGLWDRRQAESESLNGVFVYEDRVWAAGKLTLVTTSNLFSASEQDAHRRWTLEDPGTTATLYAVAGRSTTDVWAAGDGVVVRLMGGKWQVSLLDAAERFRGIAAGGGQVFAAGLQGSIRRYDGTAWQQVPSGTGRGLLGLWSAGGDHLLVAGELGTILARSP